MSTTATTLAVITGILFFFAGFPKLFGLPKPMAQQVQGAFTRFGLPPSLLMVTGFGEIAIAIALWVSAALDNGSLAAASAAVGIVPLVGGLAFHARAKDPAREFVPAVVYFGLCIAVIATAL